MERIAKLETQVQYFEKRFDQVEVKLDRIADKLLTKWDVAIVTGTVIAALGAAAIYGPRLVALITQ